MNCVDGAGAAAWPSDAFLYPSGEEHCGSCLLSVKEASWDVSGSSAPGSSCFYATIVGLHLSQVTRQLPPQRLRSSLSDAVEKSLRCCSLSPVFPLFHSFSPFQESSPELISSQKKSVGASTTGLWDFIDTSVKEETGITIWNFEILLDTPLPTPLVGSFRVCVHLTEHGWYLCLSPWCGQILQRNSLWEGEVVGDCSLKGHNSSRRRGMLEEREAADPVVSAVNY